MELRIIIVGYYNVVDLLDFILLEVGSRKLVLICFVLIMILEVVIFWFVVCRYRYFFFYFYLRVGLSYNFWIRIKIMFIVRIMWSINGDKVN